MEGTTIAVEGKLVHLKLDEDNRHKVQTGCPSKYETVD